VETKDYVRLLIKDCTKAAGVNNLQEVTVRSRYGKSRPPRYCHKVKEAVGNHWFGIEVEVENLPERIEVLTGEDNARPTAWYSAIKLGGLWDSVEDNSLRNGGREFVSAILHSSMVDKAINQLYDNLPKVTDFSNRAGIHIHTDFTERTLADVLKFLVVYMSIEEILFTIVAPHRHNNTFCVPVVSCNNSKDMLMLGSTDREVVTKYSALNICPLWQKGTIEFRHFQSTGDRTELRLWVSIIEAMLDYIDMNTEVPLEDFITNILDLRGNSAFTTHLQSVFGDRLTQRLVGHLSLREISSMINSALSKVAVSLTSSKMPVGPQLAPFFNKI